VASLIKTSRGKVPSRAVQFTDFAGERRTIRLGKVGLDAAREFKNKVETLLSCSITNTPPDVQTSGWLAGLSGDIHSKLAGAGLVQPRIPAPTAPSLKEWLDKYIAQRKTDLKPASIAELERTRALLTEFFGDTRSIAAISADGAADWRSWLVSEKKLSEATVRKHGRNVKTIFFSAVERELLSSNPFRRLKTGVIAAERNRYVTPDETVKILDACPSVQWRTLLGLCRLAGLRCPSETHRLTWADVDWEAGRLSVFAPKTERYEKHRRRPVPIVPRLATILQDAFDAAPDGQERVVTLSPNNLHRVLKSVAERAGLTPWPDLFQTLRRSCETELAMTFPQHAVSAWLGHSEAVSRAHYLQVPDELFDRAVGRLANSADESAAKSAAESAAATPRTNAQDAAAAAECHDVTHPKHPEKLEENCDSTVEIATAPGGTRTPDRRIRNPMLYPPELPAPHTHGQRVCVRRPSYSNGAAAGWRRLIPVGLAGFRTGFRADRPRGVHRTVPGTAPAPVGQDCDAGRRPLRA